MTIEELLEANKSIQLDVGCGENKQKGFIGMDIRDLDTVDIVHDFETYPWPLPDECCRRVLCSHVIEHINPAQFGMIKFMDEVWRICKVDAQFVIAMPYATSPGFYQDPTHVNQRNEITWAYFDPLEPNTQGLLYKIYKPKPWKITHLSWECNGNMEVILEKRMVDRSYLE
jgi:hypothetical protein